MKIGVLVIGCIIVYCIAIYWCTSEIKEGKCCCKEEEKGFVYEGF